MVKRSLYATAKFCVNINPAVAKIGSAIATCAVVIWPRVAFFHDKPQLL
jgi:hypothetical protein